MNETLTAHDDERNGELVTFSDYLSEGAEPELYEQPELARGWYGIRKLYRDDTGKWRLRFLTAAENAQRTHRIMEQNAARTSRR